ncbi:MAG: hypothetical protein GTO02_05735 [Candidatus Dadabacteria bacterium]|nr:hypothetical protein [Candidatus Dadabacteria bacterium]NIQ13907.1 hypothetical protein [Candidatus Dadabacteria bacterium]
MSTREKLIGTWKLVSMISETTSGNVNYPFGEKPSGYITFTEDDFVFLTVTTGDRPNFEKPDRLGASMEEKARALDTCSAYSGSYSVDGDFLYMKILCGSFPNWVGKVQKRHCAFEGNKFIATTEPRISGGKEVVVTVIWEKVEH